MCRRRASLRNDSLTLGPTRRIALSCSRDDSEMSEQAILRAVRRTSAAARPPRADDTDRFSIATSPEQVYCPHDADPARPRLRWA